MTTNEGRYFANSFDIQWISQNTDAHLNIVRIKFENLLASFMRLDVPTITAIHGHAATGGFILALAPDYRFMKVDRSVLYMSELDHGMKLPSSLLSVLLSRILPGALRDVVLGARKFSA